ncbi:hrp65 protein [Dendroctonus ponderosae]|uniref:RRM domain-containing protein n=1 Tax=Dendroctonus ponderosae TaxID=77166 RepID=U4UAD5_DENPD|nr:hrp65 protein [Dendroctonus ponderosae]ERL90012.1 hypothetical protein D910_07370 [Dendroctonus ponderosae]
MAENTHIGNVGSTNEDLRKKKFGRRGRFSSKNNHTEQTLREMSQPQTCEDNLLEREQRRPFNRPYGEKCEYAISQLSFAPTNELPCLDLKEKKFSGRNRLYIGNIGTGITSEDLEALFKPYGEVSEIFVHKDKCFGFIKLDYYANAVKARKELDGVLLKSRNLKLKLSPSCAIVKVRNLSPFVTSELLLHAFSPFGEVEHATVLVDERGKSTGEGFIDFVRKNSAVQAIQKCRDKCYFLSYALRPVIVEPYDLVDQTVGLSDKHFNRRNNDFYQDRSIGPRLAELGSFEDEYASRWKSLFDLYGQKEEAIRLEFKMERDKLEAQMEYARFEQETETLREQLRARELDKERQKKEWEAKERFAEEEKVRAKAQIRQTEEGLQAKLMRQQKDMELRQEEASLLMQAQNLNSILDTQEHLEYDAPTSSTREMPVKYGSFNSSLSHAGSDGFNQVWKRPAIEGRWIREDLENRGFPSKRRRF